jgi:hypothetical protein
MQTPSSFKRISLVFLASALALTPALAGCSAQTDDELGASEDGLSAAELARTKQSLRQIANANMGRTDNTAAVRAQVEPLIQRLARHFGTRQATQKLPLVAGAWRQLWTDYPYPMTPFIEMDPRQVYQVVDSGGHYWNIGDQKAVRLLGLTGVLRGAYTTAGTRINLEFTNVGFRFGRLSRGDNLVSYADDLEDGSRFYWPTPGGGKAPRGPVGIKGTLETLYVDADLRVDVGTQEDFKDDAGNVLVEGYGPKYFVLDRVSTPAK